MAVDRYYGGVHLRHDFGIAVAFAKRIPQEGPWRGRSQRSGLSRDWIKVKTASWRDANADRCDMLNKKR